jgi:hypothetical protein
VEDWGWVDGKLTPKLITNHLSALPEELRSLLNLRSIDLSGNPFGTIPELLLEMKQLESLNLDQYWFNRNSRCDRATVESDTA